LESETVEKKAIIPGAVAKPTGPKPSSNGAMTPKEILGMLRRHILLIIILTILGAAAGLGTWYLLRLYWPLYEAETYIKVLPPIETDPMAIVSPQVQKDIQYGHRVQMASILSGENSLRNLLRADKVQDTKWFAARGRDIRKSVKYLKRHLTVYPHRDAENIRVAMTTGDPREAALIVDELTRLFINSQGETEKTDVRDQLTDLENRRNYIEREIRDTDNALEVVRKETGLTDLEMPAGRYFQHTITLRLNELELQESELSLGITQVQADIGNLKELATGPINEQVEHAIENDPVMITLAQQIALQQAQLSGVLTRLGENHRVVREIQQLISEIEKRREKRKSDIAEQTRVANLKNAQNSLHVLDERLTQLKKLRDAALEKQKDLDEARARYEHSSKTREERVEMLGTIKEQIEKRRLMLESQPKVQILGPAIEPFEMVISRHILLWIPAGTILGILIGLALTFMIELLNDLVRTPRDVARFLHIPLLGVIPDAGEDDLARDVDLHQVVHQAPYSIIGESYRRFRTNLEMSVTPDSLRTLLVTSGNAGDGKTSVAVNLATAFVAKNERVLLIDVNFRRPSLQTIFPHALAGKVDMTEADFGLSNLLMGQCDSDQVIRPTGIEGLDVINAGLLPANPVELLASPRMKQLIDMQREVYDRVVIDSPPVLLVSDAKVLAKLVDGTVLVFNAAATRKGAATRTIFEMRDVGANVVGCVLFAVQAMKGGYFHQQFKAYRKYLKPQLASTT
jgi:capsular exopolysaccharide synthesis family protein